MVMLMVLTLSMMLADGQAVAGGFSGRWRWARARMP